MTEKQKGCDYEKGVDKVSGETGVDSCDMPDIVVDGEPDVPADGGDGGAGGDVGDMGVSVSADILPVMSEGESRFGVTAAGPPIGSRHWLVDSAGCGDRVMSLPSAVLIGGRTEAAGSVAVDMVIFLDAIVEGAARLCGIEGIMESAAIPAWAVNRLFAVFPVLTEVYHDAMDRVLLTVEAAAYKAAIGIKTQHVRKVRKKRMDEEGRESFEETTETLDKFIPPDPALSKMILTARMKERYKDDGANTQAVQINIIGPEADL